MTVYPINYHTPGTVAMMIVEIKSRETSSKFSGKISGREVTFVRNCIGSSSGKKSVPTAREKTKLLAAKLAGISCKELYFRDLARS